MNFKKEPIISKMPLTDIESKQHDDSKNIKSKTEENDFSSPSLDILENEN